MIGIRRPSGRTYEFSVVEGHQHAESSDTNTCDKASCDDVGIVLQQSLNNDTDSEDHTSNDDRPTTSCGIRKVSVDESTDPGTKFQNSSEQSTSNAIAAGFSVPGFHLHEQSVSSIAGGCRCRRTYVTGESGHGQNLTEHALVVSIHEASKSSEQSDRRSLAVRNDSFHASRTGISGSCGRKAFSSNRCHC
jgi:hypothetical protein